MSDTKIDFDSIEATNKLQTVGQADVEEFGGHAFTLEYIQEAIEDVRSMGDVKDVKMDFPTHGDGTPMLAIKPKNRSKAVVVAARLPPTENENGESEERRPVPSDIPKNKKSGVNKRLVQAEKMKRGDNTPNGMDQYLAGYIDAHIQFKDELDTMVNTIGVYDE